MTRRLRRTAPAIVALCCATNLAGCMGTAQLPSATYQAVGTTFARSEAQAPEVYVVNQRSQTVTVYATGGHGRIDPAPLATIGGTDTGLNFPRGLALDAKGRIYVANSYYPGSVTVYAANPQGAVNGPPLAVISGLGIGIYQPVGVAIDAKGRIYVANDNGSFGSVTVYAANPHGNVTGPPLATISGSATGLYKPRGIALGGDGEIYVAGNYSPGIVWVFAADPKGNLNEAPLATITGTKTRLAGPSAAVLDASGRIYVANEVYVPLNERPRGNVGSITIYRPNPHGTESGKPVAMIGGVRTGVQFPAGVTLDAAGEVYVTNQYADSITLYAANPERHVHGGPLATIIGRRTGLAQPMGIVVR